ncbi:RAD55 family ATPase [Haloarcula litorea]|uniref:RAD55 family ATPase n=1 Tax=Haloarcula litorea TaxID=3032579 RepID=UPI0023E7FD83|nr:transcriptional regulator [Halomicroarcula sp. GDY20]
MSHERDRHRTGVRALDRKLGGGLPGGTVVALTAPPDSQAELLLSRLATQRETHYVTTERTARSVRTALGAAGVDLAGVEVHAVDHETPLRSVRRIVDGVAVGSVVVDPVDVLERRDPGRYRAFLAALQSWAADTEGVAVLHCLDGTDPPAQRDRTTHVADVVLSLRTTVDADGVESLLAVPKFRGGSALTETLALELTERVVVDTSRDIA